MVAGIVLLLIVAVSGWLAFLWKLSRPIVPGNYQTVFEYYDMGYDDKISDYEIRDWSGILETKSGTERTKFQREIKAYTFGYGEAAKDKPRRTETTIIATQEYERLWREFAELLD